MWSIAKLYGLVGASKAVALSPKSVICDWVLGLLVIIVLVFAASKKIYDVDNLTYYCFETQWTFTGNGINTHAI